MKLVVARHPETNKNAGLPGEPEAITPKGQEQIKSIADVCRQQGVQAVVHSTQDRAATAAETLAKILGVPIMAQVGLEERNFGDWDNWEWSQIAAELDKLTTEERYMLVPPNGESWQQMETRLRTALASIASLGYDSVAVITHMGSIRALLPMLRNQPKESTLQLMPENGQIFVEEYSKPLDASSSSA
jgi:broad specificity phosphatase PhoE